jgi:hypothetical protein
MLKRTKGRLLLTLLVVTGFAGTINDTSLSKQERKFAITHLKDTKTDLLKSIRGLSDAQLNFKQSPDQWSIKECFYHLAVAESGFWDVLEASMKKPATPEKRSEVKISDEDLLKAITGQVDKASMSSFFQSSRVNWKTMDEAVAVFKSSRAQHLKYVKITTEDLRNHFIQSPLGWIDCYQLIIFISGYNNQYIQQISETMADTHFPKN